MQDEMRPDRSGVVIERLRNAPVVLALIDKARNAIDLPSVTAALRDEYVSKGVSVVSNTGYALIPESQKPDVAVQHVINAKREFAHGGS